MSEQDGRATKHELFAVAKVTADAGVNENEELEMRRIDDIDVQEFLCECGESWSYENRDGAREHIELETTGAGAGAEGPEVENVE
jgi:CDGSH-type Zn-finger protein